MYTVLALGLLLAIIVGLGMLAYRFVGLAEKLVTSLQDRFLRGAHQSVFSSPEGHRWLPWFRGWAGLTALSLVVTAAANQALRNEPKAISIVLLLAACSAVVALLIVCVAQACVQYLPRSRAYAALEQQGVGALWLADCQRPARKLRENLALATKNSSCVQILDVTGFNLLGKGPGLTGGLLYDTLDTMTGVPVQLLLLEPEARVLDPDQKHATVFQTLLAEMEVTPATYQRKLRATLDAVASLNERRAREARVIVRFYAEKPAFRIVVFDESALLSPWSPRDTTAPRPFLEFLRDPSGTSCFYEEFRRQFARLWTAATPEGKCPQAQRSPSTVVRRQPRLETTR